MSGIGAKFPLAAGSTIHPVAAVSPGVILKGGDDRQTRKNPCFDFSYRTRHRQLAYTAPAGSPVDWQADAMVLNDKLAFNYLSQRLTDAQ